MLKYIGIRLVQLIPVVLGATFLTFLLIYLTPGDAAMKRLTAQGAAIDEEVLEQTREEMGLNRPFPVQYLHWLTGLFHGDLGLSYQDNRPVSQKLAEGMGNTLTLTLSALALAIAVSLPLGFLAAVKKGSFLDHGIRIFAFTGNSLPNFLISVVCMYWFCIRLQLLPVVADDSLKGLLLPCLTLAIPLSGQFIRQIRAEILEQLGKEYVTGAKNRGIRKRFLYFSHIFRNCLPSLFTFLALSAGTLMGGSVVIETIFRWPGLGELAMDAISHRDYPVIQGFVVLMSLIYVFLNLLADIGGRLIDPRRECQVP